MSVLLSLFIAASSLPAKASAPVRASSADISIDFDAGVSAGAVIAPNRWDLERAVDYGDGPGLGSGFIALQATLTLGHWVGTRAELSFLPTRSALTTTSTLVLSYRAAALVSLIPERFLWIPYFTTGLGAYHRVGPSADVDFRWDWGFGLRRRIAPMATLLLEVRHAISDGVGPGRVANNVELMFGCAFDIYRGNSVVSARGEGHVVAAEPARGQGR